MCLLTGENLEGAITLLLSHFDLYFFVRNMIVYNYYYLLVKLNLKCGTTW